MIDERWLPIRGFEDRYEVSDFGRVRAVFVPRNGGFKPGRIISQHLNNYGYQLVGLRYPDGTRVRKLVHRLVLTAFVGPCPDGMEAMHLDNCPANNMVGNLRWGTHLENIREKDRFGTAPKGEKNGRSRLAPAEILDVRRRCAAGENAWLIAKSYGTSRRHVYRIKNKATWGHLEDAP
jgi:hypothetical protein